MDQAARDALTRDQVIDITTTGRSSGQPHRNEIWFHNLDGAIYITGTPGKRDWYANLVANPAFIFHVKQSATADLPAHARPITDPAERRAILTRILDKLGYSANLDAWLDGSPLVEVTFDEA